MLNYYQSLNNDGQYYSVLAIRNASYYNGITITNGNSTAFSNSATGITVTGGNNIFTSALSNGPSQMIYDLTEYDIVAYPGDLVVLCISVNGTGTKGDFGASMTWSEDI